MRRFVSLPCRSIATAAILCLSLPIVVTGADPEPEKVSVKVRPVVLFAGRDVRATVRTPRDPRNRELRIVVEGADYFASSDVQLDGVDAPTTHLFNWRELPGGAYRVDAILLRENGERTTATSCFAVLSSDDADNGAVQMPTRRRQAQAPRPETTSPSGRSGC